jgi:predicted  nucleic acid-binding Zn-ribbon protein
MSVAKQLYGLQEVDLELESSEQTLQQVMSQLGESQTVVKVRSQLASQSQRLEELKHEQHSLEWEIDDIGTKLAALEEELYSGRIKNPKELANLQHEASGLKVKRGELEDKTLEMMEQVEMATASVASTSGQLKTLEAEWQSQQQKLATDIEQLKSGLASLKHKRELMSAQVDAKVVESYDELRKQKGTAVAKVEQGVCQGCRISLSNAELQRVRSGSLMQCSSCGRILFLA